MDYLPFEHNIPPCLTVNEVNDFIRFFLAWRWLDSSKWNEDLNWGWMRFDHAETMRLFGIALAMHMENGITLSIDSPWNEDSRPIPHLDEFMKRYEEWPTEGWKRAWKKFVRNRRNKWGRWSLYDISAMEMDFENFSKQQVRHWDGVFWNMMAHDWRIFDLLFRRITEELWYDELYRGGTVRKIGRTILRKIEGDPDFDWEIVLRFHYDEYLSKYRYAFPFLKDMEREDKRVWKISKVTLKDDELKFYLKDFRDCTEEVFMKPFDTKLWEEKFENGKCELNWIPVRFKKPGISSEFFTLACIAFEHKKNVKMEDLIKFYEKNSELFDELKENHLKYDNVRNSYVPTLNKHIEEVTWISEYLDTKSSLLQRKTPDVP